MELSKAYEPKEFEDKIYRDWEKSGFFNPDNLNLPKNAKPYTIILPPPNITSKLHIGHALTLAIEDLIIRYKRMRGFKTLWVPGTDHAAIATQNVVEKKLWKEEKKTRYNLGREKFLEKVWEFLRETQSAILHQTKKMGASLDWSREAFTLDETRTKAVAKMFVDMYDAGVIYRGERVVNWCPRCHSTLADDEVDYQEQKAKFYTFKYDKNFPISISTTRPETKLGDTAVAVNPKDERYKKYIGKEFLVDFVGVPLKIKIIADWQVDMNFGTGALGVTPAHSIVDWQMARLNNLEIIKVIDEDGKITENFGEYSGKNVLEARELIVEKLKSQGLLEKEEEIDNNLSICYRCGTPIEPLPSKQWFVAVDKKIKKLGNKSLKEKAIEAAEKHAIEFIPERFKKRYLNWMKNMQDWCISRQIWFGHRIPVWYCKQCGEVNVTDKANTEIIILRHGESRSNVEDKLNSDIKNQVNGLTEKGKAQSVAVAEELKSEKIDIIFSSDFKRAQETAKIVAAKLGIKKIIFDKRLREVGVGEFEGKPDAGFSTFRENNFEKWHYDSPHGIESFDSLKTRVFSFLDKVAKKYPGKKILAVGHGDVARVAKGFNTKRGDLEVYKLTYPANAKDVRVKLAPAVCSCDSFNLKQDEDSLDTWFSSGMWTFSTLNKPGDLAKFHPTQMLETGYDIITLWVSRMVMMSFFALAEIPFEKVYLHGMVLDKNGKKMSKSRGNGIDPLDMIEKYGADASRLSLLIGTTPGNDIRFYEGKVESCRNLVNKLWNISRFILMTVEDVNIDTAKINPVHFEDKWILSDFNRLKSDKEKLHSEFGLVSEGVTGKLEHYDFSNAGRSLRTFTRSHFADWYLEFVKNRKDRIKDQVLMYVLKDLLKLWHPFMPFVTEAIWQEMGMKTTLMIAKWPVQDKKLIDEKAEKEFAVIVDVVTKIRNLRAEYKVEPVKKVDIEIKNADKLVESKLVESKDIIMTLGRVGNLRFVTKKPEQAAPAIIGKIEIYMLLAGLVDVEKEKERLEKEKNNLENYIAGLERKLGNAEFVKNAPEKVVDAEKTRLTEAKEKLEKILEQIKDLM
ncbi:class I tRNA ligase family protein [Candidatus Peregrinibacteria bacterium]|nr:class I tRNA ligase family protein [Candidatus Peregrinibacteria bacterium]MBI5254836.1 class I tRNA ligase family protein [Candidatus Falkowbacteria bacterium]